MARTSIPTLPHLFIVRGDTEPCEPIQIVDSQGAAILQINDIVRLTVNSLENPPDNTTQILQFSKTMLSGDLLTQVVFTPEDADWTGVTPADYHYDLEIERPGSPARFFTVGKGEYTIVQDITKQP